MAEAFADVPEALENSVEIARRCNLQLELGKNVLPVSPFRRTRISAIFSRPRGSASNSGCDAGSTPTPGFRRTPPALRPRLEIELVIIQMGFPGYFLIVADFIQMGQRQRGAGRTGARFRAPARWSPMRWASPIWTRWPTTCCSSVFSTPNGCRCRTSTSISAWKGATG